MTELIFIATTKMFAYIKFLCDTIRLEQGNHCLARHWCCGDIFILICDMFQNWCWRQSEIYTPMHLLASELGLPISCLLLAMHAISGCDSVSRFSHIAKITSPGFILNNFLGPLYGKNIQFWKINQDFIVYMLKRKLAVFYCFFIFPPV